MDFGICVEFYVELPLSRLDDDIIHNYIRRLCMYVEFRGGGKGGDSTHFVCHLSPFESPPATFSVFLMIILLITTPLLRLLKTFLIVVNLISTTDTLHTTYPLLQAQIYTSSIL